MNRKDRVARTVVFIILLFLAFLFVVPFVWTFLTSFKPDTEIYTTSLHLLPQQPTMEHYRKVFTQMQDFWGYFRNSVIVSLGSVLMTVLLGATTGYAFSKYRFPGHGAFLALVLLVLTLPYVIYLIPVYIMQSRIDLNNTHLGLILPYIAVNLTMAVFIMRGQFNNVPNQLMEAAAIDGCNPFQTFWKVMLPVVKPGMSSVVIMTFITVWGEFTYAKTLTTTAAARPLAVGITFLRDEAASWQYGTLTATITLSLIPVLIIFLSMQKYFIKGIMEGSLKG